MDYEARYKEIKDYLKEVDTEGLLPHHPTSYPIYLRYVDNGTLPRAGGWLDQPAWWVDDASYFEILEEYHSLPYLITEAKRNLQEAEKP